MYLLDTNVISELRRASCHGAVRAWRDSVPRHSIAIPAIVIGELQDGVEITRQQDRAKARELDGWIDRVMRAYAVIPMDGVLFREWSRLMAGKSDDLFEDAMIAATARVHGLIVVTRNVKDFSGFNVSVFNPFTGSTRQQKP
jgi:toxin FitB